MSSTGQWSKSYLFHAMLLHHRGEVDDCWRSLQSFFIILIGSAKALNELDDEELPERALVADAVFSMMRLAALLWKPTNASAFKGFIASARSFGLGMGMLSLDVLLSQTVLHHCMLSDRCGCDMAQQAHPCSREVEEAPSNLASGVLSRLPSAHAHSVRHQRLPRREERKSYRHE